MTIQRIVLAAVLGACLPCAFAAAQPQSDGVFKIGWIGPLTGPLAKYGAGQAARIAEDDINAAGGVLGKRLTLLMEDGQGSGAAALAAFRKLTEIDHVSFIVGGHCTPESAPIAPLAEAKGVLLLAAITSSPKLTGINPNFFRLTYSNAAASRAIAEFALSKGLKSAATLSEQTDYALPSAENFAKVLTEHSVKIALHEEFPPGESDFRTLALKLKTLAPQALYIAVQSGESAKMVIQALRQIEFPGLILSNEQFANAPLAFPEAAPLFEGVTFAEPEFDQTLPEAAKFIAEFSRRFNTPNLPNGIFTAESYDAVRVLAEMINDCGRDVDAVKKCLYRVKNHPGASGPVTIGPDRDGARKIVLKRIGADGRSAAFER